MPLYWTIDSKARLVTAVAEGDVTRAEFESYLDMIDQTRVHAYRKVFDGINADTSMGPEQILAVGVRMRTSHGTQPVGPLAVAVAEDKVPMVSRVLGMLAAADRPMRVFHEAGRARDWILKQRAGKGSTGKGRTAAGSAGTSAPRP
jgi:hypothetical protein